MVRGLNTDNYDNIEKENVGVYTSLSLRFSTDPEVQCPCESPHHFSEPRFAHKAMKNPH